MDFINFLLNFAALLLWLNWRSLGFARVRPSIAAHSLISNLKITPAQSGGKRWAALLGLALLLALRSMFYHSVGPSVQWAPTLDFGPMGIAFRSDFLERAVFYSLLSFGKFLGVFYLYLVTLSALNASLPEFDPLQAWVRMHLGALERLPGAAKWAAPFVVGATLWAGLGLFFVKCGMAPPQEGSLQVAKEAAIMGLYAYFPLKALLLVLFGVHLVCSYFYLGDQPWLQYIDSAARHALRPLRWLSFGKFDLAPIAGILLTLALDVYGGRALERAVGVAAIDPINQTGEFRSAESGPMSGVSE